MPIENSQVSDFSDQELSSHTSAECGFDASQQHPIVRKKNRREALLLMGKGLVALGSALFVEPPIARAIPSRQLSGSIGGGSESGEQNPHNSSVPNTPPLVYDEDPLSELRINEIRKLVSPPLFVERYSGKDRNGIREREAKKVREDILATGMAIEAGGLAYAARALDQMTSSQFDPNDNLAEGYVRVHTFGVSGHAKVGMLAHPANDEFCSNFACPPSDPNQDISIIRLVPKETSDRGVQFSLIHGVVIGKPLTEHNRKELAPLIESLVFTYKSIIIGNKLMETIYKDYSTLELNRLVADEYSPYNMELKTEALFDAYLSALELRGAFPNYWRIGSGFASNLANFEDALKGGGEIGAKEYTRYLADRRNKS